MEEGRRKQILGAESIDELFRLGLVPECAKEGEDYFFVSYSHSDFREVYADLFEIMGESESIRIWMDKEMAAGRSWVETARLAIRDYHCQGVLLYLGNKTGSSRAILEEIRIAARFHKPLIPVLLPSFQEEKERLLPKTKGIAELCIALFGIDGESDIKTIKEGFRDELIYVDSSSSPSYKATLIANTGEKRPLCESILFADYAKDVDYSALLEAIESGIRANPHKLQVITKVNDAYLESLKVSPEVAVLGKCSCANLQYLRRVEAEAIRIYDSYCCYGDSSLEHVFFNEAIQIGEGAFENCVGLVYASGSMGALNEESQKLFSLFCHGGIGARAFKNCFSLRGFVAPKKLRGRLGDEAFRNDKRLENVELDETLLADIGEMAFKDCRALESIFLPKTLESLGPSCFENCDSLDHINLSKTKVSIIPDKCFLNDRALESIDFPPSLRRIEASAFECCPSLKGVDLSHTCLERIGARAFDSCLNLESARFPETLRYIDYAAFFHTRIRELDFSNCLRLADIDICLPEESLEIIHMPPQFEKMREFSDALDLCGALKTMYFPSSVSHHKAKKYALRHGVEDIRFKS